MEKKIKRDKKEEKTIKRGKTGDKFNRKILENAMKGWKNREIDE